MQYEMLNDLKMNAWMRRANFGVLQITMHNEIYVIMFMHVYVNDYDNKWAQRIQTMIRIIITRYSGNLNKMRTPTREPARDENNSSRI